MPQSRVEALAAQCQVQTDNPCQFLPQEVVRKFSEMSPEEVFSNTLRAIGVQESLRLDQELKEARGREKKGIKTLQIKLNAVSKAKAKDLR